MLIRLVKQVWLVMLVVFAIGWSSVSVASANTMHLVMSTEKMSSHCLEMKKPTASHSLHKTDHHQDQNLIQPDCVSDNIQQSSDCLDCGTMACQNLVTSLPIATPELSMPDHGYSEKTLLPAYHAKHLAGYWQEILRPPKA
ncbi:hypothetical protein NI462_09205 [Acinetobacter lwoffii]|uniref:hypothetical protein n=1 Tax=Acinetobacter lwoffii TaxID=28090 RepID=UPI00209A6CDA|nr:hypothetical protein [Acinetobacter lwoffii]MCO8097353.1 hypothetical protein [Acinetobacter lwoffii]